MRMTKQQQKIAYNAIVTYVQQTLQAFGIHNVLWIEGGKYYEFICIVCDIFLKELSLIQKIIKVNIIY